MLRNAIAAATLIPLVAACATPAAYQMPSSPSARPSAPPAPQQAPPVAASGFRVPQQMRGPGLEGVIGANSDELIRQFGTPRLDVWEDDARKLQFTGTRCVLDIYLYPQAPGRREIASWVEARRSDGQDVDRAACVAAMRRR